MDGLVLGDGNLKTCVNFNKYPSGHIRMSAFSSNKMAGGNALNISYDKSEIEESLAMKRVNKYLDEEEKDYTENPETARQRRARRLKRGVFEASMLFAFDRMLTLTTRKNIEDVHSSIELCRSFLKRAKDRDLINEYIAVPERQLRGAWHWHIAVKGRVDINALRELWCKLNGIKGSGAVNISKRSFYGVDQSLYIAKYLTKYITKSVVENVTDEGYKIIRCRSPRKVEKITIYTNDSKTVLDKVRGHYRYNNLHRVKDHNCLLVDVSPRHKEAFDDLIDQLIEEVQDLYQMDYLSNDNFTYDLLFQLRLFDGRTGDKS